jgi:hypothetical protein
VLPFYIVRESVLSPVSCLGHLLVRYVRDFPSLYILKIQQLVPKVNPIVKLLQFFRFSFGLGAGFVWMIHQYPIAEQGVPHPHVPRRCPRQGIGVHLERCDVFH